MVDCKPHQEKIKQFLCRKALTGLLLCFGTIGYDCNAEDSRFVFKYFMLGSV